MKRRTMLAASCLLAQEPPIIRVQVKLVRLLVTVKDAHGEPIGTLRREDFAVTDTGVAQEIAVFERSTAQALSVSLLIDTSLSTATHLEYEARAIKGFLTALYAAGNPDDGRLLRQQTTGRQQGTSLHGAALARVTTASSQSPSTQTSPSADRKSVV